MTDSYLAINNALLRFHREDRAYYLHRNADDINASH